MTDLATGVCLTAIDRIIYLRDQMKEAVAEIEARQSPKALVRLQMALKATDNGTMKEWLPGEEPF